MSAKEAKDPPSDWENMGGEAKTTTAANSSKSGVSEPIIIIKKRPVQKKFREIPEYYFLPQATLFYGSFIAAGVGCGMVLEGWMNKKVQEDAGGINFRKAIQRLLSGCLDYVKS